MTEKIACLLPENVKPVKYHLWLAPNLKTFTFEGVLSIDIEIKEPTNTITLHADDLVVKGYAELTQENLHLWGGVSYDKERQIIILSYKDALLPGLATLKLNFTGQINDQLYGFYRSKYNLPNGEERYIATTQCEAIDARRIFPCWDEPASKAVIEVVVRIPKELVAISNMPIVKEDLLSGDLSLLKEVAFAPTPPMSTYLFAMMVGEFEWVEAHTNSGILVRVCTTPGKKDLGNFALDQAVKTLEFYTEYFGVPYPLPKLDLVAIPDFAAGAMENWGADTFRETTLLIDPRNSSAAAEERVVEVVDHELAHQWHGNLVTMRWWDSLWLNEGFASWMELIACKRIHPDWKPEDRFIAEDFLSALNADALKSSRPVQVTINNPHEINESFDAIAYSKGASMIRMLENFLGPEVFRRGLGRYMRNHAYSNTDPRDLWDSLELESIKPVRAMMDTWLRQTGYPVIHVKREHKNGQMKLELSQERFLYEKNFETSENSLWNIPVGITTETNNTRAFLLLDTKKTEVDTSLFPVVPNQSEWIKLNAAHTGFFRVNYEPEELLKFRPVVMGHKLPVADRIELCDDAYALTRAGHYSADLLLDFFSGYKNEMELPVWQVLLSRMNGIRLLISHEPYVKLFESFVRDLTRPIAKSVGWVEAVHEGHQLKILRGMVLRTLGEAGEKEIIEEAQKRFEAFLKDHDSLNPNLRGAVYGIVASVGDETTYEAICDLYKKEILQEEQLRLLGALTDFQNPDLLAKTLKFFIGGEVRSQDVYLVLRSIATNPAGRDLTWQFVKENWETFRMMYEDGKLLGRVIEAVCKPLASFADVADVRSFFETHPVPDAKRTIEQSLESIRINAKWLERDRSVFASWLTGPKS